MGIFDGFGRLVKVDGEGRYEVRIGPAERELLATLLPQLRALLLDEGGTAESGPTDPMLARLFPPAHPDDAEQDEAYRSLVHEDLLGNRLAAIDLVERTLEQPSLDEEQVGVWMRTVNELRLVLGTKLDVSEDDDLLPPAVDDDKAPLYAAYAWLGVLLEELVQAQADALPPPDPGVGGAGPWR